MENRTIIAIDFDGTIVTDNYPKIGYILPGAAVTIRELYNSGNYYIIINTCRQGSELTDAVNFLLDKGIPFHRINDSAPWLTAKHGYSRKIHADVFIDANNVGGMPEWHEIPKILKNQGMPF